MFCRFCCAVWIIVAQVLLGRVCRRYVAQERTTKRVGFGRLVDCRVCRRSIRFELALAFALDGLLEALLNLTVGDRQSRHWRRGRPCICRAEPRLVCVRCWRALLRARSPIVLLFVVVVLSSFAHALGLCACLLAERRD